MTPELGHFALILALCVAVVQGVLPLAGARLSSAITASPSALKASATRAPVIPAPMTTASQERGAVSGGPIS